MFITVSFSYACVPPQICDEPILTGGISSVSDPCTGTMFMASRDIYNRVWIAKVDYQKQNIAEVAYWCLLSVGLTSQTPSISLGDGTHNNIVPQTVVPCNPCECKAKKYLRIVVKGLKESKVFVGTILIDDILCETKTKTDDPCPIQWDILWE